jgi:hypothetical protein
MPPNSIAVELELLELDAAVRELLRLLRGGVREAMGRRFYPPSRRAGRPAAAGTP